MALPVTVGFFVLFRLNSKMDRLTYFERLISLVLILKFFYFISETILVRIFIIIFKYRAIRKC